MPTIRENLEEDYSDAHKADLGVRPRDYARIARMSDAELDARIAEHYRDARADAGERPTHGEGWAFQGVNDAFSEIAMDDSPLG